MNILRDPRSAFKSKIFEPYGVEFYWVGIERTSMLARLFGLAPKRYQATDAYMMYFKNVAEVAAALKEKNRHAPAWRAFIESVIKSPNYVKLNLLTRGSMELSAAAAVRMIAKLGYARKRIEELDEAMKQLAEGRVPPGMETDVATAGGPQRFLMALEKEVASRGAAVAKELDEVAEELKQYMEAKGEAEAAVAVLSGGHSYSLEGLSIWHFYERPDEFRRRVKLLRDAARMFRRFMSVFSEPAEQMASLWGGISGATLMTRYEQVVDATPYELAAADESPELFAVKVATKQMIVRERGTKLRLILYVDKSGSMAEPVEGGVPKISVATGLALALHRKYNAEVYLFDTEVDRVAPRDVIETLLKIRADGGTDISQVMEDVLRHASGNSMYIIISDGITDAPKELVDIFIKKCGRRTRLILIPPADERYGWIKELKKLGNVYHAKDVAQFEKAAVQAVSP
jgi:uncharacterized protein with von Willebrand factor type A (vWA) domain